MTRLHNLRLSTRTLLLSASALAIASVPAQAADVLFSTTGVTEVAPGERVTLGSGVLQLRLDNGATLSFVEGAEFTLNADGSVDLHKGSVTVAGAGDGTTLVRMPEGVEARVGGTGNAANFRVRDDGESDGHTLTGKATITRGRTTRDFAEGQMWESSGRSAIRRIFARESEETPATALAAAPIAEPVAEPQAVVADLDTGGPVAAAENGLPVSLGDGLAAAGASSDVVALGRRLDAANGNPVLETYPTGDLARLVALAADLQGLNGGTPFPAAQADIIRTYLRFLANGGSGAQFLTAYAGFLTQYLDLVRAGGLPSQFGAASVADINAFLAYQQNLGRLATLTAQNRALAETYLAFLRGGGNPDLFASTYTDLVEAYFAFVRGGGDPLAFTGATQEVLDAYIAFLGSSGLAQQLSAADQAILAAYLESGSFAFAATSAEALQAYFGYLQGGGLPSASANLTPVQLRAFLELLDNSGLFVQLLGDQAPFYAAYLAFLQNGGAVDDFGQLNANIFAGYVTQLNVYFAFLQSGGQPSAFAGDPAVLAAYLEALSDAGALEAFLGANAGFFAQYLAFLQGGGSIDGFAGLNFNIFTQYAAALDAYYTFLAQGGLPSEYQALTQEQIAAFVAALQAQGASTAFLAGLAGFYGDYLVFLQGGGNPDLFTGLPTLNLPAFAAALNAYAAFLAGGGLPSEFAGEGLDLLAIYLDAIGRSGDLAALLGGNADLLSAYFAFFGTAGDIDNFSGLPLYASYVSALQAYFTFLDNGGLPANYTVLTPQQIQSYLAALSGAGGFGSQLGTLADFYTAYFAYLSTGGPLNGFSGLPIYAEYVTELNAYFAFLAGGGLPGAYTLLTAQQIADYLAALNGAGGLAAFGSLNGFFTQYFAFIAGGGNPANFSGLPLYADYVTELNAYFAFLAAGGLPGDYTLLTAQQIADYLAALNGAGGLAAFGSLNTFFVQYFAFLQGGGDPDDFGGLPIFVDYLAAVQAFYAYLAGGGLPSGYAALTQAQIEAYLAVLDALGLLAASFQGDALAFWSNYLAFLTGGGVPDDFGGFPSGTAFQLAGTAFVGEPVSVGIGAASVEIASNGTIGLIAFDSGSNRNFRDDANFTVAESGRVGETAAWTRYLRATNTSTPNWQNHVLVGAPSVNLPASGTVEYRLIGGTAPNNQLGTHAANGSFEGALAVSFGSSPRVGFEMDVYMDSRGWRASTNGGAANARFGGWVLNPTTGLFQGGMTTTGILGEACANECSAFGNGGLFGEGGENAGLVYGVFDEATLITGIAIFGTSGTELDMIGTRPTPPAAPSTLTNQSLAVANLFVGDDAVSGGSVTYDPQGRIVGYQSRPQEVFALGSASIAESDSSAGITWTRWASGTPAGDYYGTTSFAPLGANGGWHVVAGDALANMPASGTVAYDLVGFTTPTRTGEGTASGSVSGSAAVLFGANPRFGLDIDVTSGNDMLNLATDGGVTDVSQSRLAINAAGVFNSGGTNPQIITTNLAGNFCTSGCLSFVQGFLSGDGAAGAGLSYAIRQEGVNSQGFINGTAAFVAVAPSGGGGGNTGGGGLTSDFTGTRSPIVYYTYTGGSLASGFGGSATLANGELTGFSSAIGTITSGNTQIVEAGDVGVFAWGRWTNGSVTNAGIFGNAPTVIGANGGYHVMAGQVSSTLPASGKVDYDLIAITSPTDSAGSAPGTITGDLAIQFGTVSKVGYNMQLEVGGLSWAVATTGGAANPGASEINLQFTNNIPTFGGTFHSNANTVTGAGGACAVGCQVGVSGVLYGTNGAYAGVAMNVLDIGTFTTASGLAIFAAPGASSSGAAPGLTTASALPATAAMPEADWDRWSVSDAASLSSGNGMSMAAPGLDQLAASGIQFSPEQMVQLEAHIAAQRR